MKYFDIGSIVIIVITFLLFVLALFYTGFTHDILLETGVFLVSVKLIVMAYKAEVNTQKTNAVLQELKDLLEDREHPL